MRRTFSSPNTEINAILEHYDLAVKNKRYPANLFSDKTHPLEEASLLARKLVNAQQQHTQNSAIRKRMTDLMCYFIDHVIKNINYPINDNHFETLLEPCLSFYLLRDSAEEDEVYLLFDTVVSFMQSLSEDSDYSYTEAFAEITEELENLCDGKMPVYYGTIEKKLTALKTHLQKIVDQYQNEAQHLFERCIKTNQPQDSLELEQLLKSIPSEKLKALIRENPDYALVKSFLTILKDPTTRYTSLAAAKNLANDVENDSIKKHLQTFIQYHQQTSFERYLDKVAAITSYHQLKNATDFSPTQKENIFFHHLAENPDFLAAQEILTDFNRSTVSQPTKIKNKKLREKLNTLIQAAANDMRQARQPALLQVFAATITNNDLKGEINSVIFTIQLAITNSATDFKEIENHPDVACTHAFLEMLAAKKELITAEGYRPDYTIVEATVLAAKKQLAKIQTPEIKAALQPICYRINSGQENHGIALEKESHAITASNAAADQFTKAAQKIFQGLTHEVKEPQKYRRALRLFFCFTLSLGGLATGVMLIGKLLENTGPINSFTEANDFIAKLDKIIDSRQKKCCCGIFSSHRREATKTLYETYNNSCKELLSRDITQATSSRSPVGAK